MGRSWEGLVVEGPDGPDGGDDIFVFRIDVDVLLDAGPDHGSLGPEGLIEEAGPSGRG